ncbi:hypothetical protein [Anaeromyxobacter sp. Fw109-5]|uniref:hypothetical protein n=1 Tax=Anaeromyxobacter sp. (strain Fw109-5) TaxID=404589 RepID=UPI0000ED81F6|nr:hypothetical protein [Anaeromyxobacter sp. Fw109-5]ABS26088.1 conserved hypothetical protein [Anaeromyxobacter sp. Fw109-5]
MTAARRLPFAALGFAVAAALSSWNPLSAPFAVVVGLAAAVLAVRAAVEERRRPVALTALGLALAAAAVGGLVLARTAGLGRRGPGESLIAPPSGETVERDLDDAAGRTRAARERALEELKGVEEGQTRAKPPPGERDAVRPPNGAGQR